VPVISSKAPRRAVAVVAVSVAMLFSAACGSDEATTDNSGTTGQNGGGNTAFAAYTECLSKNGVTITMPSGGPGGGMGNGGARPSGAPDGAGFPSGAPDGVRPSGQPRPQGSGGTRGGGGFPGGGGAFSKPEGVDDATWTKAQEACASLRPSMGAGRGNGGNGNGGGGRGANAAYENCLKENGVTDTANPDTSDATVKKAVETCSVLKPTATAAS
jgi:hypothetical protein